MLTHPTLDTLRALRLAGMAQAFEEQQTTPENASLSNGQGLEKATYFMSTQTRAQPQRIAQGSLLDSPFDPQ